MYLYCVQSPAEVFYFTFGWRPTSGRSQNNENVAGTRTVPVVPVMKGLSDVLGGLHSTYYIIVTLELK